MKKKNYYSVIYATTYPDAGVISYKPMRIIRGSLDEKEKIFIDEDSNKQYCCVDMTIPNFGNNKENIVNALNDEIVKYGVDGEEFYAFPIEEETLLAYCNDPLFEGMEPKEFYERNIRSYFLYSLYDEECDDNLYYLADKYEDHLVYKVDVNLDFAETFQEENIVSQPSQQIVFVLTNEAFEEEYGDILDDEEDEDDNEKVQTATDEDKKINSKNTSFTKIVDDFDPDELEQKITDEVIGQDHVAKSLVSMIYKNKKYHDQKGLKSNMLILGPSGCGKTELARSIERNTDIPVVFFDASSASASGYIGNSVTQAIKDLLTVCNGDREKAENGIIVIDEIDKLTGDDGVTKGDVQDELFKMLEGDEITIPGDSYREKSFRFNPKNVTFIGVGAAQNLIEQKKKEKTKVMGFTTAKPEVITNEEEIEIQPEELIKYGFKPELLRRFPIIKVVKNLDKNKLVTILSDSKISNLRLYEEAFRDVDHVKLVYKREILEAIADRAIKEKAGASGLKRVVDDMLESAIRKIRLLNGDTGELVISKQTLENPANFKLYRVKEDGRELVYPPKEKIKKIGEKK